MRNWMKFWGISDPEQFYRNLTPSFGRPPSNVPYPGMPNERYPGDFQGSRDPVYNRQSSSQSQYRYPAGEQYGQSQSFRAPPPRSYSRRQPIPSQPELYYRDLRPQAVEDLTSAPIQPDRDLRQGSLPPRSYSYTHSYDDEDESTTTAAGDVETLPRTTKDLKVQS